MGRFFGPLMVAWFTTVAVLGVVHLLDNHRCWRMARFTRRSSTGRCWQGASAWCFGSSANLVAAYGVAVTATMLITTMPGAPPTISSCRPIG